MKQSSGLGGLSNAGVCVNDAFGGGGCDAQPAAARHAIATAVAAVKTSGLGRKILIEWLRSAALGDLTADSPPARSRATMSAMNPRGQVHWLRLRPAHSQARTR